MKEPAPSLPDHPSAEEDASPPPPPLQPFEAVQSRPAPLQDHPGDDDGELNVALNDAVLDSMSGSLLDPGDREGGGLVAAAGPAGNSLRGAASRTKERAAAGAGGGDVPAFTYWKAFFFFILAQLLVLMAVGFFFRRPVTHFYETLVERGYIDPSSLPWQGDGGDGRASESRQASLSWEDVRRRYELTLKADEAITTANRAAYNEIVAVLDTATDTTYRRGAKTEILRVQEFYSAASRLPPEPLDLSEAFPGQGITEADLTVAQIEPLIMDPRSPWEMRCRLAALLAGRRDMSANQLLVRVMEADSNLDVVKQAMISFVKNTGYSNSDFFNSKAAVNWWSTNASRIEDIYVQTRAAQSHSGPLPASPHRRPSEIGPGNNSNQSRRPDPAPFAEGAVPNDAGGQEPLRIKD